MYRRLLILYIILQYGSTAATGQEINRISNFPLMTGIAAQLQEDSGRILNMIRSVERLPNIHHDSTIQILQDAITQCREIGYTDGIAYALIAQGNKYAAIDSYALAKTFYTNALPYSRLAFFDKEKLLASVYMNLALILTKTGVNDSAISYMYKTMAIAQHIKDTGLLIYSFSNIAVFWTYNYQHDRTLYYGKKALDLAQHPQRHRHLASIYNTLAAAYGQKNDTSNHFLYAQKAVFWSRKTHNQRSEAHAYSLLGYYYLKIQKPDSAVYFFRKQIALADSLHTPLYFTEGYRGLGQAYRDKKVYAPAIRYMMLAAGQVEQSGMQQSAMGADIYLRLAQLLPLVNRSEEALAYFERYHEITMNLLNAEKAKTIEEFDIKYQTAEKDYTLLQQQLHISRQENNLRNKNIWIAGISAGALFLMLGLFVLYRNKAHQQRLQEKQIHILRQENEIGHLKAIMQGEEKERTRLAQELHDGIGGMMASIKMNFSAVKKQHPEIGSINGLNEIMSMLEETTSEVRKTAHNLMPNILLRYNLEEALRIYCSNINAAGGLSIALHVYHQFRLKKPAELFLYRIIQELIQNIVKHARATEAIVEMERQGETIHIIVEDNGTGFDVDEPHAGIGLQNLKARIRALQGAITIESAPEIGTTIQIHFPVHQLNIMTA